MAQTWDHVERNRVENRCVISALSIKETQIKSAVRSVPQTFQAVYIKDRDDYNKDMEKGDPLYVVGGNLQ